MLSGRANEIKYLETCYEREGSQLLVVYGREDIGKTSLVLDFCKDKKYDYYLARPCSIKEQLNCFLGELGSNDDDADYDKVFNLVTAVHCRKKILVIDEFHNFLKSDPEFMDQILRLIHNKWNNRTVMVVLVSSAFSWIENQMVSQIGSAAYEISGFLKVRDLSFLELVRSFPDYSFKDLLGVYAVLGGVPGLWQHFNPKLSLKDNICNSILKKGSALSNQAFKEISEKLREPSVYHTILKRMAGGEDKLNDLYISTGYNRAKISVYLKNLMELEIVEKVYSEETDGHDNARKGIYRLNNNLISFYFRFVFPYLSRLEYMAPTEFFDKYIEPSMRSFLAPSFTLVCREFMELMNQAGKLPIKIEHFGSWSGKVGDIDIIGQSEDGKTLCGVCSYEKDVVTYDDYEWMLFCLKQAKLSGDQFYLFTGKGFDDRLIALAKENKNIHLIDPTML